MRKQKISEKAINMKKGKFFLLALCAIMLVQCYCKTTVAEAATRLVETVYNGQVAIEFIDVASSSTGGKADATLIATKSGNNVVYTLVDCGTAESSDYLVKRLKERGVTTIENLILTHNHSDHVGGLESLLKNFKVNNIYMNNEGGESVQEIINKYGKKASGKKIIPHAYYKNDNKRIIDIDTGDNSSVQIKLYKSTNTTDYGTQISNLNERSLVVEVVGDNASCLLLGDLRLYGLKNGELKAGGLKKFYSTYKNDLLINNKADKTYTVVKVGHHGYRKNSKYNVGVVEEEVNYYNDHFKAKNYVFTATSSVLNTTPKKFNEFKKLKGTCCWFKNIDITFGNWSGM